MDNKAGLISPCEFNSVVSRLRAFFVSKNLCLDKRYPKMCLDERYFLKNVSSIYSSLSRLI